ncbi:hypothetical protein Q3G72_002343 [Acer saccharum]|nr:hypothetical protein Q3G72_002343 [Acer saccharum]
MNSSTFPFPWLHAFMFSFLLTALSSNPFLSSATPQVSYADHCNSLLPEATIYNFQPAFSSFVQLHTGYYTGQKKTLSQSSSDSSNSLSFCIRNVYKTDRDGVFGIEEHLVLRSSESKFYYVGNVSHSPGYSTASVSFRLHGFRSESSGEVCMVGRGFSFTRQGRHYNPEAVLKLSNLSNSSSVEGSLILRFRNRNYMEQDMSLTYASSFYSTRRSRKTAVSFNLKGFWSEYGGELCMVGTSSSYSREELEFC